MIPRPEDPRRARQVLALYGAIIGLVVVGVVATVVLDSYRAGLVIIGGGAAIVGAVFGMKLARELNPEASSARLGLARVLMLLAVAGVVAYMLARDV